MHFLANIFSAADQRKFLKNDSVRNIQQKTWNQRRLQDFRQYLRFSALQGYLTAFSR